MLLIVLWWLALLMFLATQITAATHTSVQIAANLLNGAVAEARADEARATLERAKAMPIDVAITRAQLLVAERDSRIAAAQLEDAREGISAFVDKRPPQWPS